MSDAFIRLPRSVVGFARSLGPEYLDLYVAVLSAVNYLPGHFQGVEIKPGQMVLSWRNIAERLYPENPPAINTIRNRLKRLAEAGLIQLEPAYKFGTEMPAGTLLTVSKFDTRPDTRPDTEYRKGEKGKESKNKSTRKRDFFDPLRVEIPPGLDSESFRSAWSDWCAHRTEIRKPITPTSSRQQLAQLATWGQRRAIAAISHTITKGWQGIREPEGSHSNGHQVPSTPPKAAERGPSLLKEIA